MTKKIPGATPSRETIGVRRRTHAHTTGRKSSPTYNSWHGMLQRCLNPSSPAYDRYGGRGITVCKRWRKFSNFLSDMGERPDGLTLERKNNNKGYGPKNCRWASYSDQALNKRSTKAVIRSDGARFKSPFEAAAGGEFTAQGIYDCCLGNQKTHRGFGWRYA